MLYKKDIYQLIGIRRDCFVPRNDGLFTWFKGVMVSIVEPWWAGLRTHPSTWLSMTPVSPFAFRLLPLTSVAAFSLLLFALSFSGCSLNPNLQGKGEAYIQGEWQQDSSAVQQKLVTASQYHAKFDCDSFYVAIKSFSKVNYGSDTCMRSGRWAEYIKGTYRQRNDTLFLKGQFCNANFTLKTNTDCFRVGPYEEFFKISKKTDSLIQLSGTSSVIPVNLNLIKKTSCTQKPL